MKKIGIIADCSSGVEYAPFKNNVKIARTMIRFGDKELVDGIDCTADEFYELVKKSDVVPSTSAPTYGEIGNRLDELKKEGCEEAIMFTISSGLSTYSENLKEVKDEIFEDKIKLHVFDSQTACLMEGYNAHYAEILADKGYSIDEIFEECDKFRKNTNAYFVVDDLKYLVKNGRLSSAAGFIGSLVSIKPVLNLGNTNKIITFEKVRTKVAAVNRIINLVIDEVKDYKSVIYVVLHTGLPEEAAKLAKDLEGKLPNAKRIEVTTITPTVGAHIGNGIIGFARIICDNLKEEI